MDEKLQRLLLYFESVIFIVLILFFVRTVAVFRSDNLEPLSAVAERHASQLVRKVNPEAGPQAIEITTLATKYALTGDSRTWHNLANAAWRARETREVLSSRIQRVILDESLSDTEKRSRVCEIVTGQSIVAVMPGSGQNILSALSALGINPVLIRREDGLLEFESFELVVIGSNSMTGTYKSYYQALGPVLLEYVCSGGRILILSQASVDWAYQWLPGRVIPSAQPLEKKAALECADHPVLAGVDVSDLPIMYSDSDNTTLVYPLTSAGPEWRAYIAENLNLSNRPVLAEARYGFGRILLCQLALDTYYGHNLAASKLLDNLIAYLLVDTPAEAHGE